MNRRLMISLKALSKKGRIIGTWLILLMVGCGSESRPGNPVMEDAHYFSASVPTVLDKHLTQESSLTAEMRVEGPCAPAPRTIPLTLDIPNRKVTGQVGDLGAGDCTFTMTYKVNSVIVATGTKTALIRVGQTTPVHFDLIRYEDSDNDGFTNLAEIELFGHQSNAWNDGTTKPPAEVPRSSANYVMVDIIGAPFLMGTASSTDYTLTSNL